MSDNSLATVAYVVSDFEVVINRGAIDGVEIGQRYLVFSIAGEIEDPDTGESLGRLEISKGTGRVIYVQEKMATVRSDVKQKGKIVKRSPKHSRFGGYSVARLLLEEDKEEIEEYPEEEIPFDDPERGDKVKLI
ncbi:hypothetical protein ACDI10_16605 [Vreelandella venusta]|uniref:hypothetical protein n=1 Tax=Vreelandella venusta TaxID=44935 RepID=UPI0035572B04